MGETSALVLVGVVGVADDSDPGDSSPCDSAANKDIAIKGYSAASGDYSQKSDNLHQQRRTLSCFNAASCAV